MSNPTDQNEEINPSQRPALTDANAAEKTQKGPSLSWTVWPMGENPLRSAVVIAFLIVTVWAIASAFGAEWFLGSIIILVLLLGGYFFPTHYLLDSQAVSARGLISRKKRYWSGLKKYAVGNKGVHLSPYARPSKLESLRGIYLPFGTKREEILHFIEERMNHGR